MTSQKFDLADGRSIGVSLVGEPTATRLVVLCLPTPGAGGFDPDPLVTIRHPVRLVCIDRPGYGGSDDLPAGVEPTIERFADDIAEYLRHTTTTATDLSGLALGPVAAIGWSFGALVAMSLAARHPDLIDRLAIVSAATPKRLRHGERYSPVTELRKHGVERSRASLTATLDDDGRPSLESLGVDIDEADALGLGTAGRIEHMIDAAWTQGGAGIASDRRAAGSDSWTDGLEDIEAQALLVYSDDDPVADASDAKWYAARLPRGSITEVGTTGRLAIIREWSRILDWAQSSSAPIARATIPRGTDS